MEYIGYRRRNRSLPAGLPIACVLLAMAIQGLLTLSGAYAGAVFTLEIKFGLGGIPPGYMGIATFAGSIIGSLTSWAVQVFVQPRLHWFLLATFSSSVGGGILVVSYTFDLLYTFV